MSMKNSDTIGNRFRDLPVCSAVPQPLRHRVPPPLQCKYISKLPSDLLKWYRQAYWSGLWCKDEVNGKYSSSHKVGHIECRHSNILLASIQNTCSEVKLHDLSVTVHVSGKDNIALLFLRFVRGLQIVAAIES
jgi:hypothetical protein